MQVRYSRVVGKIWRTPPTTAKHWAGVPRWRTLSRYGEPVRVRVVRHQGELPEPRAGWWVSTHWARNGECGWRLQRCWGSRSPVVPRRRHGQPQAPRVAREAAWPICSPTRWAPSAHRARRTRTARVECAIALSQAAPARRCVTTRHRAPTAGPALKAPVSRPVRRRGSAARRSSAWRQRTRRRGCAPGTSHVPRPVPR